MIYRFFIFFVKMSNLWL